jgi:hypothetical protein
MTTRRLPQRLCGNVAKTIACYGTKWTGDACGTPMAEGGESLHGCCPPRNIGIARSPRAQYVPRSRSSSDSGGSRGSGNVLSSLFSTTGMVRIPPSPKTLILCFQALSWLRRFFWCNAASFRPDFRLVLPLKFGDLGHVGARGTHSSTKSCYCSNLRRFGIARSAVVC